METMDLIELEYYYLEDQNLMLGFGEGPGGQFNCP